MTAALRRSFASLSTPNYRRYFTGQVVSVSGNWMQIVAEGWLLLKLTGSGLYVGVGMAVSFLPLLLLGAWGGVIADRYDKRKVLLITQPLMALPPLVLATLVFTHVVTPLLVLALILCRGLVTAFDNPARQSFVSDLVGSERVVNAVSLNSVMVGSARVFGPALAAVVIASLGVGACFVLNAASFGVMVIVLRRLDVSALRRSARAQRARGQIRDALRVVRARRELWLPLAMMTVIGTFSFNFPTILPLAAKFTWHGTATTYAALLCSMALGSVIGALRTAAVGRVSTLLLVGSAAGFGVFELGAAIAPSLGSQMALLVGVGMASTTFAAAANSSLQLAAEGPLRGRVMALFSIVFIGSTPIGAPIVGWLSQATSPRWALALGAVAALITAAGALAIHLTSHQQAADEDEPRFATGVVRIRT